MKINVTVLNDSVTLQIFDAFQAFLQSQACNFESKVQIAFNDPWSVVDFNVLFVNMPTSLDQVEHMDRYDLIFLGNNMEPLSVATTQMKTLLEFDNVYVIANSYLAQSHALFEKVIWWPEAIMLCHDYYCRNFYPHHYQNMANKCVKRNSTMIAVRGQRRTNRHYFFSLLASHVPDLPQIGKNSTLVFELLESQWETDHDLQFRQWSNLQYDVSNDPDESRSWHKIGIDNKFGTVMYGYDIMSEYFENSCVVFAESSWQNLELSVTEKACKCFYAGCLPMPIGGAWTNQLYGDLGFYTAWHLLPDDLQTFDSTLDHKIRYQQAVTAITWLQDHCEIFDSAEYHGMITSNKQNFLDSKTHHLSMIKLKNIFYKASDKL